MIFDRTRFYLIASAVAVLIAAGLYFALPRVTPEQRVREQLALLAKEPWVQVEVQDAQYAGANEVDRVLVRGVRLDTGAAVTIDFRAGGPYTSNATLEQLTTHPLAGDTAEVLMLPKSLTCEPWRSRFDPQATHVGVALFAGLPPTATTSLEPLDNAPADSLPSAATPPGATDG